MRVSRWRRPICTKVVDAVVLSVSAELFRGFHPRDLGGESICHDLRRRLVAPGRLEYSGTTVGAPWEEVA
ncbi:MAG: hypothetical protein JST59_26575 [Actinobacteria bacterium]|nr:hypothetical protein [Actinomycetota bacterium]